jgi:hypothetical protein
VRSGGTCGVGTRRQAIRRSRWGRSRNDGVRRADIAEVDALGRSLLVVTADV